MSKFVLLLQFHNDLKDCAKKIVPTLEFAARLQNLYTTEDKETAFATAPPLELEVPAEPAAPTARRVVPQASPPPTRRKAPLTRKQRPQAGAGTA